MTDSDLSKSKKEEKTDEPMPEVFVNGISEDEQQVINQCVTHSFKYTNSNCESGGLRVSSERHLDTPLLCSMTVNRKHLIIADYQKNSDVTPVTRSIRDILSISTEIKEDVYDDEKDKMVTKKREVIERVPDLKAAYIEMLGTDFESEIKMIDPRLRQILLPLNYGNKDSQYNSIIPLACGGLSRLVMDEVNNHNFNFNPERDKESYFIKTSKLGFGGSNAQNSGYMLKLGGIIPQIYTESPGVGADLSELFSVYYNGIKLFVNDSDVVAIYNHLISGNKKETVDFRIKKEKLLFNLVSPVLNKAKKIYGDLQANINDLPGKGLRIFDNHLDLFQQRLITGENWDRYWKRTFCEEMSEVTEAKLKELGLPGFNGNYHDTLEHSIKKAVF